MGYKRYRYAGSQITDELYFESKLPQESGALDTILYIPINFPPPIEGANPRYELRIDINSQKVGVYYNFQFMFDLYFTDHTWEPNMGHWVIWSGEIGGYETDMPGIKTDPCEFSQCEYYQDSQVGWSGAAFQYPPDYIGIFGDTNELKISYVSGANSFNIWDAHPLP